MPPSAPAAPPTLILATPQSTISSAIWQATSSQGYQVGSGFQGFTVNGFTLIGFNQFSLSGNDYLPDQSLPGQLSNGTLSTDLTLTFIDAQNTVRNVDFLFGNITPVPVPTAGLLFSSGLIGLVAGARRKINKS